MTDGLSMVVHAFACSALLYATECISLKTKDKEKLARKVIKI